MAGGAGAAAVVGIAICGAPTSRLGAGWEVVVATAAREEASPFASEESQGSQNTQTRFT